MENMPLNTAGVTDVLVKESRRVTPLDKGIKRIYNKKSEIII